MGMPSTRSSVSTRRLVRRQSTSGTTKPSSSAKFWRSSDAAAASKRRSISIITLCANVRMTSTGRSLRQEGSVRSAISASQ